MLSASRAVALTKEPAALDPLIISSAIVSAQFFSAIRYLEGH